MTSNPAGRQTGGSPARPHVDITEVGTRDGFQSEATFIPTDVKARVIDAMIDAGVRRFEATSFVSPRAVPQLADAHDVIARVRRRVDAHLAALVPNARGAERALGAGVDEMVCFVSASETHNQANLNASIASSLENVGEIARLAKGTGVALRGAVACAFGCPFEGEVPVDAVLRIIDRYASLADYGTAKARIFEGAALQVVNREDPAARALARAGRATASFGLDAPPGERDWGLVVRGERQWLAQGTHALLPADALPIARRHWRTVFGRRLGAEAAVTVPDLRAVLAAVVAGAGWSVLPRYLCADELAAGRLALLHEPANPPDNTTNRNP